LSTALELLPVAAKLLDAVLLLLLLLLLPLLLLLGWSCRACAALPL
jgi:hypothetical protein